MGDLASRLVTAAAQAAYPRYADDAMLIVSTDHGREVWPGSWWNKLTDYAERHGDTILYRVIEVHAAEPSCPPETLDQQRRAALAAGADGIWPNRSIDVTMVDTWHGVHRVEHASAVGQGLTRYRATCGHSEVTSTSPRRGVLAQASRRLLCTGCFPASTPRISARAECAYPRCHEEVDRSHPGWLPGYSGKRFACDEHAQQARAAA